MRRLLDAIDEDDQKEVFFPALQFNGAKKVERIVTYGPSPNTAYFWFLYPKLLWYQLYPKMMEYQQVLKITTYCSFDFTSYPFDSHKCDFNFGMKEITSKSMQLNATLVRYMQHTTKYICTAHF